MTDSNSTTSRNIMCECCQQNLTICCEMKIILNSYRELVIPRRVFVGQKKPYCLPHSRELDVIFVGV